MVSGVACSASRRFRLAVLIAVGLVASAVPSAALADSHDTTGVIQQIAVFPVTDPPDAPLTIHQSMLLFMPGVEIPDHSHEGPGFITVLSGELTLVEDGVEARYWPGDSVIQASAAQYTVANYTAQGTTLMATYLIPLGDDVPVITGDPAAPDAAPEALAGVDWEFHSVPASFDLVQTISTFHPQATTGALLAEGDILKTVVNGSLSITTDGEAQTVNAGESILIESGSEYIIENPTDSDAMTMSTQLLPYPESEPEAVAAEVDEDEESILPDAGSAYQEPVLFWLLMMTAAMLIVIGGVMRIGADPHTRPSALRNR